MAPTASADPSHKEPGAARVLLVDDAAVARSAVSRDLRARGFIVDSAGEGREGLWRLESQAFDIILTDVHMPTMDGIEFIRELRKMPNYAKTPVLVFTSDASRMRYEEGKAAGATAWLMKPVPTDLLVQALNRALELSV